MARTAVVLIHGIGEQRPLATLREFVTALVGTEYGSVPDRVSGSLESRILVYPPAPSVGNPTLHFLECYWAPQIRDTTWGQVTSWAYRLLTSSPPPTRLQRPIWFVRLLLVLSFLAAAILAIDVFRRPGGFEALNTLLTIFPVLGIVLSYLLTGRIVRVAGDAARYLDSGPANVPVRDQIRRLGLDLLQRLHEDQTDGTPTYDRIVIVGHSLGSVIAYDLLKFYWTKVASSLEIDSAEKEQALVAVEQAGAASDLEAHAYQSARNALFRRLCGRSQWRISDLVTLGSPLTYADFLLGENDSTDFEDLKQKREFPTCPPVRTKEGGYSYATGKGRVLHHAALFVVTRWTNLYFSGDLIGGSLRRLFGNGIVEECFIRRSMRSHTTYWDSARTPPPESLAALRRILLQ